METTMTLTRNITSEQEMLIEDLRRIIAELKAEKTAIIAELEAERVEKTHLQGQLKESQGYVQTVLNRLVGPPPTPVVRRDTRSTLVTMTPKQHAVLQMLLRGAGNKEIADRMLWVEETAKGSIRNIGMKLGLSSKDGGKEGKIKREYIDDLLRGAFETMDPDEYRRFAKIPKDWDETWTPRDRIVHPFLYEKKFT